jgi:hypothetical protein
MKIIKTRKTNQNPKLPPEKIHDGNKFSPVLTTSQFTKQSSPSKTFKSQKLNEKKLCGFLLFTDHFSCLKRHESQNKKIIVMVGSQL